jgi:glycosyltransferase involved in cell wall biosynthesis
MTAPCTVGFLHPTAPISGAERSLLILLANLDRHRFRPVLFAPPGPLFDAAEGLGVECRPWPAVRLRRREPLGWARLALAAVELLRRGGDLDLVHANAPAAALAALPWRAWRRRPLIWQVRDLRLPDGLVRLLAPRCEAILAISRAVARRLVEAGAPPRLVHLLPNALDPAACRPTRPAAVVRAELGLAATDEVLLCLGQLVPWKGHDTLLAALGRVPRPGLKVVLAGADLFGEHRAWERRLRAAAPAGRVIFAGYRADVADLLAASDVLVLPSRGEPFGRVLLEAYAAGRPVIATVPGGPAEVVAPGRTGWLARAGDAASLAAAIAAALAAGPARRAAMGAAGSRMLRRGFSPASQVWRLGALYDKLSTGAGR